LDLEAIRSYKFAPVEHRYTTRDTILYALGLGYGSDPTDFEQLKFVYENGLKAMPSLVNVLAHPGFWAKDPRFGIDWVKILHGEQSFEIFKPLPPEGTVRGEYIIQAIEDMGSERGAKLYQLKHLFDAATDQKLATVRTVLFMRGDGGQGGFGEALPQPTALPDATPDQIVEIATLPQQALIYRLSGDFNPIHADPVPAQTAGFPAPILHGLCSLGIATRAILQACAGNAPEKLKSLSLRFSKPVFPGETLAVEIYRDAAKIHFRCRVKERGEIVLDRGRAELTT
jgi:acyl dehydratase